MDPIVVFIYMTERDMEIRRREEALHAPSAGHSEAPVSRFSDLLKMLGRWVIPHRRPLRKAQGLSTCE